MGVLRNKRGGNHRRRGVLPENPEKGLYFDGKKKDRPGREDMRDGRTGRQWN